MVVADSVAALVDVAALLEDYHCYSVACPSSFMVAAAVATIA